MLFSIVRSSSTDLQQKSYTLYFLLLAAVKEHCDSVTWNYKHIRIL